MFDGDEIAIVTGGTKGIGRSVSLQLAERGVTVVATYYSDEEAAAETEAELETYDQPTGVVQFDVGDHDAVARAIEDVVEEYGRPSVLVNNAGMMKNNIFLRMSADDWDDVVQTNLSGAFYCTKEVLSHMVRRGGGTVVNVSSVGGLRGWAGQANYAASKAGLIGMTRSLAREVGGKDVRVNAVCPGYTETELLESSGVATADSREEQAAEILEEEDVPQDRIASPDEVANAVVFLASEEASYVNGAVLRIDGGLLA